MAGFRREATTSRYGRSIRHSSKVQQLLTDSICEAYDTMQNDLQDMESRIRSAMAGRAVVPQVKQLYGEWLEIRSETQKLYLELHGYVSEDIRLGYRAQIEAIQPTLAQLMSDVEQYCDHGPLLSPVSTQRFLQLTGQSPVKQQDQPPNLTGGQGDGRLQAASSGDNKVNAAPSEPDRSKQSVPISNPKTSSKGSGAILGLKSEPESSAVRVRKAENPRKVIRTASRKSLYQELREESRNLETEISRIEEELEQSLTKLRKNLKFEPPELRGYREMAAQNLRPEKDTRASIEPPQREEEKPMASTPRGKVHPEGQGMARSEEMLTTAVVKLTEIVARPPAAISCQRRELPTLEPTKYDGSPLKFTAWWSSFLALIDARAESEEDKLIYLHNYTQGKVQELVGSFMPESHLEATYSRARNAVLSRYGDKNKIAAALKRRLNDWTPVMDGDPAGLLNYSDFLLQCNTSVASLNYLGNLNSQEENLKMVRKLPKAFQQRWLRHVDQLMYGKDYDVLSGGEPSMEKFPSFDYFCKYVANEARIQNTHGYPVNESKAHPPRRQTVLSAETHEHTRWKDRGSVSRRDPGAGSKVEPREHKCMFCTGEHHISTCEKFLENKSEFKKVYARTKGLCYGCLQQSHLIRECTVRNRSLMASPKRVTSHRTKTPRIVPVKVFHPENAGHQISTYAMIDTQSDGTFLGESLLNKLRIESQPAELEVTTITGTEVIKCRRVPSLIVQGDKGTKAVKLRNVYTKDIPSEPGRIPDPRVVESFDHLRDIAHLIPPLKDEMKVEMLIGFDHPAAIKVTGCRASESSNMFAMRTPLGWTVMGNPGKPHEPSTPTAVCYRTKARDVTPDEIRKVFDQPFGGEDSERTLSADDVKFLKIVQEGARLVEGQWEVPLPLRYEPEDLPDSYPMAYRSLMSTGKKMKRDPVFGRKYKTFMNDLVENHTERVPEPWKIPKGKKWYWSHHGVHHPDKPDVVRGVFNGAGTVGGFCINDILLPGPDLTNNLVGVLCRFREERKSVKSDIKNMFHQVLVTPRFRNLLTILWFEDGDPDKPVVEYRIKVHLFGATSSPGCVNFALKETARRFGSKYDAEVERYVKENFYVDDGLGSQASTEKSIKLAMGAHKLCKEGGFHLHKFASNEKKVLEALPQELVAKDMQELNLQEDPLPGSKALGVNLNLETDQFEYRVQLRERPLTRRGCLSALSGIYDPLGFVAPCILQGRRLLQEMCLAKLDWDDPLTPELEKKWKSWYNSLAEVNRIKVDRCVKKTVENPTVAELHIFCDASGDGYGATGFLRLEDEEGNEDTALMLAKSKVPPAKSVTIPRMELQAAVEGVKLGTFLKEQLRYENLVVHYYTDSMIVLGYVTNDGRRFTIYVANRATYIREKSENCYWHHVPTQENPADIASRGAVPAELAESKLWFEGPKEIMRAAKQEQETAPLDPEDPEIRKVTTSLSTAVQDHFLETAKRWSSWRKLLSVYAICLRFCDKKCKRPERSEVEYRAMAARAAVRIAQRGKYAEETELITKGTRTPRRSALRGLDPFVDETGTLRVRGRFDDEEVPREYSQPVVLPEHSWITTLVVRHYHQQTNHLSAHVTLCRVRQSGYWVVKGKQAVGRILTGCAQCIRKRGRFQEQQMAPLPEERISCSLPFENSGVDLFGPYYVKAGRTERKRWCCLFTCMYSRGVHIEIVSSLTTSAFINACRRASAKRGKIRKIFCDRGTNFVGGSAEQDRALMEIDFEAATTELAEYECDVIQYEFNAPHASHMGGAWERMIRTVRSALDHVIIPVASRLDDDLFKTVVAEAEAIVNSRPVSYLDSENTEDPLPLSPSMLLALRPLIAKPPPGVFGKEDEFSRKTWRFVQALVGRFWKRWRQEVLPEMIRRQKWNKRSPNLKEGDVVILYEEATPRPAWPLGRVTEAMHGKDGRVRRVKLRVRGKEIERPIHKLIKLL